MEKQVLRMEEQTAEKQAAFEDTEAKLLQKMRDAGPSDLGATEVPSLTLFLQQFWSDIQRDLDRVQAVRRGMIGCTVYGCTRVRPRPPASRSRPGREAGSAQDRCTVQSDDCSGFSLLADLA